VLIAVMMFTSPDGLSATEYAYSAVRTEPKQSAVRGALSKNTAKATTNS